MSSRHRDVLRPPIASRPLRSDPRAEADDPGGRDVQMACLARIALVRRSVVIEHDDRPAMVAPTPRPDFARPPRRPVADHRGTWCFRPGDERVEVIDLPDDD
jgi:hypothetical protein